MHWLKTEVNGSPHVLAALLVGIGTPVGTAQWVGIKFALNALKRKISVPAGI
jgi:hypothetical protein